MRGVVRLLFGGLGQGRGVSESERGEEVLRGEGK